MPEPTLCCRAGGGYCDRCDLLVGLPGMHVILRKGERPVCPLLDEGVDAQIVWLRYKAALALRGLQNLLIVFLAEFLILNRHFISIIDELSPR